MQLSSLKSITRDNVIFEEAVPNQHGHERINIKIKHAGTVGENKPEPLVIASPFRFSFGVQPSLNKSGDVVGYTLPTPLWNHKADGSGEPTQKEFAFYEALKELKHICYQYLDEAYGIDVAESIKFPLIEKEGKAPVLYPRLMYSRKSVAKQLKQSHYKLTNMKLTSLKDINKDNVIFEKPYCDRHERDRINIKARGENNPRPLVITVPFGVSVLHSTLNDKREHVGYHFISHLRMDSLSSKEVDFINTMKELKSLCYKHVDKVYGEETAEKMKFPMRCEGSTWTIYPKLMYNKAGEEIRTLFYTGSGKVMDPLFYLHKFCQVKMTIVIDCILNYDDEQVSVQINVNDVYIKPLWDDRISRLVSLSDEEEEEEEYGPEATETYWPQGDLLFNPVFKSTQGDTDEPNAGDTSERCMARAFKKIPNWMILGKNSPFRGTPIFDYEKLEEFKEKEESEAFKDDWYALELPWSEEEDLDNEEDDPEGCFCTRQTKYHTSTEFLNATAECKNTMKYIDKVRSKKEEKEEEEEEKKEKEEEEKEEEEEEEGEADQLASSADIEKLRQILKENLRQLDKEKDQEGDSKEEDQEGDSEEEDQEEVSHAGLYISNSKIPQIIIAHKETVNLLTKKQKKDLVTALQSGGDLLIHLTQRQYFGGFLSTLPTNIGVMIRSGL
ncbi:hypothetical protein AWC38_SpisGene8999 [Stylophora pistillata]|uniref:Uncharacterized protein n=1 Tax=Stylophora pistillata TaxID=50429 RepID=A0A2B4SCL7_STYPI|nr:hypothetical protein AWC38_SpisGene8999 [Stylophora pistillata]